MQFLRLLTVAAVASALLFAGLDFLGESAVARYYKSEGYLLREEQKHSQYIDDLQEFISENSLSSSDREELSEWVTDQKMVAIRIYMDDKLIFDSVYPEKEKQSVSALSAEENGETYYTLDFADGSARASIISAFMYQLYNYVVYTSLVVSFAVFLVLVLLGIRRKMQYISKLSNEIDILEGGSLDYPITVRGKDEISALAEGIENMRLSVRSMIERETKLMKENRRIVTEMSHDLRTPVTSIMLYTEILKKGGYIRDSQGLAYVEKIDGKARRMKQLADHLFEYTLITGASDIMLEEPENCELLFYDLLSETCSYLEQKGFRSEFQTGWPDVSIQISTDYVMRILDNITSNIVKYADPAYPVEISAECREEKFVLKFENEITIPEEVESSGIGIQSIESMMLQMGGECRCVSDKRRFSVSLCFPQACRAGEQ